MPPRPPLPDDDLYARLGVPFDASPEAIEVAWRGLLRRHHPDIAGPDALELAKRINVAHDWLADPDLRRRYDRERRVMRHAGRHGRTDPTAGAYGEPPRTPPRRRPPTVAERTAVVVDRVGRLSRDDLDRLGLAEPAPIAFLATLRRFVTPELQAVLDRAEEAAFSQLPAVARREVAIRDAVSGKLADLILGDALDELLGDPDAIRARERLTRGWDAAVGQPRYGPGTVAVDDLLARLRDLPAAELRSLAATGTLDRLGEVPWPAGTSPDEDQALRVSSDLAGRDASSAVGPSAHVGARRAAARIAHLLVLRHAIDARAFDRLAAPWLGGLIPRRTGVGARVRHRT